MVFLVENLTLLVRARTFPFSMDLARFEPETGRSSCGGREPAKCKGNDSGVEVADEGEVVVDLDAAVPKGAPRAWIGFLGLPDEDWGI
jgi:hypothetical protein